MSKALFRCCCTDKGCPSCGGTCAEAATALLCRFDMSNAFDLPMCEGCEADALDSGVFASMPIIDEAFSPLPAHYLTPKGDA